MVEDVCGFRSTNCTRINLLLQREKRTTNRLCKNIQVVCGAFDVIETDYVNCIAITRPHESDNIVLILLHNFLPASDTFSIF